MEKQPQKYNPQFTNEVKGAVIGEGNIIYNYYYHLPKSEVDGQSKHQDDSILCPYRSLYSFTPNDSDVFFGRDFFIDKLYKATQKHHFISLLGASGSGKSSVILAGLVPKLQKESRWKFTHFRPGQNPFQSLSAALVPLYASEVDSTDLLTQSNKLAKALQSGEISLSLVLDTIQKKHPQDQLLLICDQFEEIYTLHQGNSICRKFLDCILEYLEQSKYQSYVVWIIAMRADFLGDALSYRPFAKYLDDGEVKLGSMSREELREVIEKPIQNSGVTFEVGLVERILDDINDQPGNLPLLEFALTELWSQRNSASLSHTTYEKIGGVEGALARHANQIYSKFKAKDKKKIKQIFIQLVYPENTNKDTRRSATKKELGGDKNWHLVTHLANDRLIVTSRNLQGEELVELAHESLIYYWDKLQEWINENRQFRAWQEQLRVAKKQWEATNYDVGSLLRGVALVEAEKQLHNRPSELYNEADFITKSKERKTYDNGVYLAITIFSFVAISIIFLLTGRAYKQQKQSEINRAESLARQSMSLLDNDKDLDALLQAIEAGNIVRRQQVDNPVVQSALLRNLYEGREINRLQGHNGGVTSISFSPNGRLIASAGSDRTIRVWDSQSGKEIQRLAGNTSTVASLSFSPDGQRIVSGSQDGIIKLWELETGNVIHRIEAHSRGMTGLDFSSTGDFIVSGSRNSTAKIWDSETGEIIKTFRSDNNIFEISLSPDEKILATAGYWGIDLWDLETGDKLKTFDGNTSPIYSVDFSRDGKLIAAGDYNTNVTLWDVETGSKIQTLRDHQDTVYSVKFSPIEQTIASGSGDKNLIIWDLRTGAERMTIRGQNRGIYNMDFNPRGDLIAIDDGGTIRLIDISPKPDNMRYTEPVNRRNYGYNFRGHTSIVSSLTFSPNHPVLASASYDGSIQIWDWQTPEIQDVKEEESAMTAIGFSPDSRLLLSGADDGTVKLWEVSEDDGTVKLWEVSEREYAKLAQHNSAISTVAFSPNGEVFASASSDGIVKIWNLGQPQEIMRFRGQPDGISNIAFSSDNRQLAAGGDDGSIEIWDLETTRPVSVHTIPAHQERVSGLIYDLDENTLTSSSHDGTIKVWDLETGREIDTFFSQELAITAISFSPSGQVAASSSSDGTIRLFNRSNGDEIYTFKAHTHRVNAIGFSPKGEVLASAGGDEIVKLWVWGLDSLLSHACFKVFNYLQNNPNVTNKQKDLCDSEELEHNQPADHLENNSEGSIRLSPPSHSHPRMPTPPPRPRVPPPPLEPRPDMDMIPPPPPPAPRPPPLPPITEDP
ncbi:hypothetical protein AY600_00655 [Phormidium willei BDU 130791]|nr:hypothetical protein AY600_00655 [Phormidium willei BDU 130791]